MKTFIKYLIIKLLLVCSFCYSQNQFPHNQYGNARVDRIFLNGQTIGNMEFVNGAELIMQNNSRIYFPGTNNLIFGNTLYIKAHDYRTDNIWMRDAILEFDLGGILTNDYAGLKFGFQNSKSESFGSLAAIGINKGATNESNRLYLTFGSTPWNSSTGINVLPNGNTGIGTISPTTKLEITTDSTLDPNNYGDSGLRLTNLTSNNNPIVGAAPIGVDATGKVVRVDVESSSSSDRAWLTLGNTETIASTASYGSDVNNNFLGTTDNQPLVIATNSKERLRISTTGRITFHNNDISPNNVNNLYLGGGNTTTYTDGGNYANTAVGLGSLALISSGYQNLAVGSNALRLNTSGKNNIGLGYNAGTNITTGSDNILIGSGVDAPISATADNQINIGNQVFGYNGQIAIGSYTDIAQAFSNSPGYKLIVKDGIRTEKVRVDLSGVNDWADDVFEDNYDLLPIENLREFIEINRHLPGIPKAEQLVDEGIDVVEMDSNLLRKIEELTLYNIELYDENKRLKEDLMNQQIILEDLIKRIDRIESAQ